MKLVPPRYDSRHKCCQSKAFCCYPPDLLHCSCYSALCAICHHHDMYIHACGIVQARTDRWSTHMHRMTLLAFTQGVADLVDCALRGRQPECVSGVYGLLFCLPRSGDCGVVSVLPAALGDHCWTILWNAGAASIGPATISFTTTPHRLASLSDPP